ncbi:type II toxin-antitoxin system Phd/YefM family antitoxin [Lonepinella sp. BR2474]|uniref:type II toxin-antitoxin system Phd/YefM family antitoxin n=1 Tax=Lonepinella sp. BR2474 TaxID=3434548 RepID=UPI003F6E1A41
MPSTILTNTIASITELKINPMATVAAGEGGAVAILNRNEPAFYCLPPALFERFMDMVEDMELAEIVRERENDEEIEVNLEDLLNEL